MATGNVDIIISAKDNASKHIQALGSSFLSVGNVAKLATIAVAGFATAAAVKVAKAAFDLSMDLEQTSIAFETMIGSAEQSKKTMKELADFSLRTPFQLAELQEASKRLLAYNVEAKELIPTMEMLGNITAGVGKDKLGQLILAFGQVKAATYLTGAELRQFTEAGVPLFDTLAKQMGTTAAQVKENMEDGMKIPFEQVEEALGTLTQEGGKFYNLMEKQSKSASGVVSNLSEKFNFLKLAILGVDPDGTIQPGGLFDTFKDILQDVLSYIEKNEGAIISYAKVLGGILSNAFVNFLPIIVETIQKFVSIEKKWMNFIGSIVAQSGIIDYLKSQFMEVVAIIRDYLIPKLVENKELFISIAKFLVGTLIVSIATLAVTIKLAVLAFTSLVSAILDAYNWFKNLGWAIQEAGTMVGQGISGMVDTVTGAVQNIINAVWRIPQEFSNAFWSAVNKAKGALSSIPGVGSIVDALPGFANGVENFKGGLAVVGERGPELVHLPRGSSVTSNEDIRGMMSKSQKTIQHSTVIQIYNPTVRNDNDIEEIARSVESIINRKTQLQSLGV